MRRAGCRRRGGLRAGARRCRTGRARARRTHRRFLPVPHVARECAYAPVPCSRPMSPPDPVRLLPKLTGRRVKSHDRGQGWPKDSACASSAPPTAPSCCGPSGIPHVTGDRSAGAHRRTGYGSTRTAWCGRYTTGPRRPSAGPGGRTGKPAPPDSQVPAQCRHSPVTLLDELAADRLEAAVLGDHPHVRVSTHLHPHTTDPAEVRPGRRSREPTDVHLRRVCAAGGGAERLRGAEALRRAGHRGHSLSKTSPPSSA